MKKIYTTVSVLLLAATVGVAQTSKITPTQAKLNSDDNLDPVSVKASNNNKAAGDQIWIEDFDASGSLPTGWYTSDNTGNGFLWEVSNGTHNATYTSTVGPASNSGANHIMLFGDSLNSSAPFIEQDSYIQTSGITLSGEPNVSVRFFQRFRLCCSSSNLMLEVSTDSSFATSTSYNVSTGTPINAYNVNEYKTVNITSAVGGYTGKIWLRFHWALGASHYIWMIDDLEVFETEYNDLVGSNFYYGTFNIPYTQVPVNQIQPVDFFMNVDNIGSADQLNTFMDVDINGSSVATSVPGTITAGTVGDSLGIAAGWTPPASPIGVPYNITLTVSSDSVESTPGDNSGAFMPLTVSQDLYAIDDMGANGYGNGGGYNTQATPPTEEFEAGNWFDIFANDTAYSIDVVVGSNTQAGAIIDAVLYDASTGSFVEVPNTRSAPYSVTAGDISSNATITLTFPQPAALTANTTYFAAVHAWAGTGAEFYYGTSGRSEDGQSFAAQQSLIFYPNMANPNSGENFYTTQSPTVRLRTKDFSTSVADVTAEELKFNVYPNPSTTGEFTINLNSATTENVNLMVTNVVGQTVVNRTVAVSGQTKETISLADYSKGVYFLTVNNETVKLIVE